MTNFNVFSLVAIIFVVFMFGTGIGLVPFIMSKELSETPSHHHEELSEDGFTVQIDKALRITNNKQLFSILSNELNTTQEQKSAAESQAQSLLNQLNGVFKTRWGSQIDRLYNIQLQPSGENVIDVNLAIHTKPIGRSEIQALRDEVLNTLKSGNIQVESLKLTGLGSIDINKQELSVSEPIRGELPARSISAASTRSFRSDEAGVSGGGNGEAQRTVGKNRNININIKRLKDFYIYKNPALIHQYLDRANSYRHPNPAVGASVSAAYSNGAYSLKNRYNNAKSSEEESEESSPSAQSYDKYEGEKYYPAKSGKYQNKYDSDGSYVHPDGYKPVRPHDEQDKKYADGAAASKSDKPKMKTTQTTSRSNNGHALKNEEYEVYNKMDEYKPKSKEYKPKKEEPSYEKRREEPEEEEEEERAQQSYVDSSKEYAKMGGEASSRNKSSSPSSSADQNAYKWAKKQKQLYMPESSRVPSSSMPKRRESNEYTQNQSDKSSKYGGQSGEEGKRQRVKESSEAKPHPDGYKPVKTTVKPSVNANARYSEEYEKSADYSHEQVKTTQAPKPSYLNSQPHSDEDYKLVVTTTPSYAKIQVPTSTKMVYYVEKVRPISNEYEKAPIQYVPSRPVEIEEQQPVMSSAMSLEQAPASRPQYVEQRQPEYVEEEAVNDQETQLYEREQPYRPYAAPVMEQPVREYYPVYEPPTTYMPMTTSTTQSTTTEAEKKNDSDDNNSHRRRKHRKHKKRKHHHRKSSSPTRQPSRVPERKEPANKSSYNSTSTQESMRLKNEKSSVGTSSASPLSSSPSTSTTKPGSANSNNNNNSDAKSSAKSRARKDASFLNKNMFRSLVESHAKTNNMIKEIQTQIDRTGQ